MSTTGDFTPWVQFAAASILVTTLYDFAKRPTGDQNHEALVRSIETHIDLFITSIGEVASARSGLDGPNEEELQALVGFLQRIKDRLKEMDSDLRDR